MIMINAKCICIQYIYIYVYDIYVTLLDFRISFKETYVHMNVNDLQNALTPCSCMHFVIFTISQSFRYHFTPKYAQADSYVFFRISPQIRYLSGQLVSIFSYRRQFDRFRGKACSWFGCMHSNARDKRAYTTYACALKAGACKCFFFVIWFMFKVVDHRLIFE